VSVRAQALLANAFAAHGVRGYDFRVLAALDQFGPSSQADLGRYTGIDRSDVVATVNALVAGGLARRAPDPVDARRNVVTITPSGTRMLARLDVAVDEVQEALLAPLNTTERRTFAQLLRKLS
jgi:DNA-binding MarR family transcriptional regulator